MNSFLKWWDRASWFLWPGMRQRLIADVLTIWVAYMLLFDLILLLIRVLA